MKIQDYRKMSDIPNYSIINAFLNLFVIHRIHSMKNTHEDTIKLNYKTYLFKKVKLVENIHPNCQQTHIYTDFMAPYRNRTETVPKKEKTYRTVRFQ